MLALLAAAALGAGCVPTDFLLPDNSTPSAALVPSSPFGTPAPVTTTSASARPACTNSDIVIKVDEIGRKLIAANASLGIKPAFTTVGEPQAEIFHRETAAVFVSEGLVRKCKTEGQLAAILSMELGRMISERESSVNPAIRNPEKPPPLTLAMGNAGQFSGLESIQQAEIAQLDRDRRRPSKKYVPPDPQVLARGYLDAAGFDTRELDNVAPFLQEAERNYIMEKQFNGSNNLPSWAPK
jgi:hypothetical protein